MWRGVQKLESTALMSAPASNNSSNVPEAESAPEQPRSRTLAIWTAVHRRASTMQCCKAVIILQSYTRPCFEQSGYHLQRTEDFRSLSKVAGYILLHAHSLLLRAMA